jgi:hypothetical protein
LGQIEETSFVGQVWKSVRTRFGDGPVNVSTTVGVEQLDTLEFKFEGNVEFMFGVVAQIRYQENMRIPEDVVMRGTPVGPSRQTPG